MKKSLFLVPLLLSCAFIVSYGQKAGKKMEISGTITDINKKPVPGVNIFIDNQSTGKVSNSKGVYKIRVSPGAKIISIMTLSGNLAEAPLNGQTVVDFSLQKTDLSDSNKPEDISDNEDINIGYGTVKQKDLLTPVEKIKGKGTSNKTYVTIYDMLRGKAGVQVNGTSIIIHGASSFMSGTDPLFIVDGVAVTSIDGIQPSMVRSIQILKGSSASIYGTRGANGVIIIDLITGAKE